MKSQLNRYINILVPLFKFLKKFEMDVKLILINKYRNKYIFIYTFRYIYTPTD